MWTQTSGRQFVLSGSQTWLSCSGQTSITRHLFPLKEDPLETNQSFENFSVSQKQGIKDCQKDNSVNEILLFMLSFPNLGVMIVLPWIISFCHHTHNNLFLRCFYRNTDTPLSTNAILQILFHCGHVFYLEIGGVSKNISYLATHLSDVAGEGGADQTLT